MKSVRALLALSLLAGTVGCPGTEPALTPARKLVGRWVTPFPVTMSYQTDFCNDVTQNISTAQWTVSWDVTAQEGYSNVLDIEMHYQRSGSTPTANGCGGDSGWVPLVSPTFLEATLSSTEITGYDHASGINVFGSYTTSNMAMTWVHHECIIYCTGEVSGENKFILVKQ